MINVRNRGKERENDSGVFEDMSKVYLKHCAVPSRYAVPPLRLRTLLVTGACLYMENNPEVPITRSYSEGKLVTGWQIRGSKQPIALPKLLDR